jgi:hypothetical protein
MLVKWQGPVDRKRTNRCRSQRVGCKHTDAHYRLRIDRRVEPPTSRIGSGLADLLEYATMALTLCDVMTAIYECEENCSLSSDWDGGWRVTIGGSQHATFNAEAYVDNPRDVAVWLHEQAVEHYPAYKARYGDSVLVSGTKRLAR